MPEYEYEYDYSPAVSSPSSSSAPSSSSLLADFPGGGSWFASTASPPTGSLAFDSVLVASDPAPSTPVSGAANKRRVVLGPNAAGAGRAGKRRARPSKRAPTTYISTDPDNFRLMVQHVTGVEPEPTADGSVLPLSTFDAALLDYPPFDGAFGDALRLPSDVDAAALHRHHQQQLAQQQQLCYPTLDSWSVMYEQPADLALADRAPLPFARNPAAQAGNRNAAGQKPGNAMTSPRRQKNISRY
ncbi:hypothetical protein CFC21_021661 [Triticum aestivum]|uniref:VQ domain-containing protein n=2 Tax=Triticum aestivum TaxID=4565 RepID=A0A9R1EAG0_WHEAT|nr:hypothetical protein CFC21_021661 [Triticum aestivum]